MKSFKCFRENYIGSAARIDGSRSDFEQTATWLRAKKARTRLGRVELMGRLDDVIEYLQAQLELGRRFPLGGKSWINSDRSRVAVDNWIKQLQAFRKEAQKLH